MRIELVKRPQRSVLFSVLSPFIALALTVVAGAIMFSLLGKPPGEALSYYFIQPLSGLWNPDDVWQLHELAIKAAPLILIGVGLSVCYTSNNWNIGAEGQFVFGAIAAGGVALLADKTTGRIEPTMAPTTNWPSAPMFQLLEV